jgi:hypothetical protein
MKSQASSDSEFGAVKGNNSHEYYKSIRVRKVASTIGLKTETLPQDHSE